MSAHHDKDLNAWSLEQADLLRKGKFEELDMEHLIEEIETLSASDRRALRSHLIVLLMHLLKKEYQFEKNGTSWERTIWNARADIHDLLNDNPSFIRNLPEYVENCYNRAAYNASYETGLPIKVFPKECQWTLKEILGE